MLKDFKKNKYNEDRKKRYKQIIAYKIIVYTKYDNIYGFALGSGNSEGDKKEHKAVLTKHIIYPRRELLTCYTRCHGCHDRQGMECHV